MGNGFDADIQPEEYFRLSNGRVLKNLYELMNALKSIDEDTFKSHVNEEKNDFGNWIKHIFRDDELADSVFNLKSPGDISKAIQSRLMENNQKEKTAKKPIKSYPFVKQISKNVQKKSAPAKDEKPAYEKPADNGNAAYNKVISQDKIDQILMKEKEIAKREEKIEEIETKIEQELNDLSKKKEPKFFSKEFMQGMLIGLLAACAIGLLYIKFLK